jgi:hypothetical protein
LVAVGLADCVGLPPAVGGTVTDSVAVAVGDSVLVGVEVAGAVGVSVAVRVAGGTIVSVGDGVAAGGVTVTVGVSVTDSVGVLVAVGETVTDGVSVAVGGVVLVGVGDEVGVVVAPDVAVDVAVAEGVGVDVSAGVGHPVSALFTPWISSLTDTSPSLVLSKLAQVSSGRFPRAMLTPLMSSSMLTAPLPLQSPTQMPVGGVASPVGVADTEPVTVAVAVPGEVGVGVAARGVAVGLNVGRPVAVRVTVAAGVIEPRHVPLVQRSLLVHGFLSSHAVPSGRS